MEKQALPFGLGWMEPGSKDSFLQNAALTGLGGAGIGAAAMGGAGALLSDEEDPDKRNENLKNNLIMGAGLGGATGLGYNAYKYLHNPVSSGVPSDSAGGVTGPGWLKSTYNMLRGGASHPAANGALAGGYGGVKGYQNSVKLRDWNAGKASENDKWNFTNTFNQVGKDGKNIPYVVDPAGDTSPGVQSAKSYVNALGSQPGAKGMTGNWQDRALHSIRARFGLSPDQWKATHTNGGANKIQEARSQVFGEGYATNPVAHDKGFLGLGSLFSAPAKNVAGYAGWMKDKVTGSPNPRNTHLPWTGMKGTPMSMKDVIDMPEANLPRGVKAPHELRAGLKGALKWGIPSYLASRFINHMGPEIGDPAMYGKNFEDARMRQMLLNK